MQQALEIPADGLARYWARLFLQGIPRVSLEFIE
jgi:hypothetical protein